MIIKILVGLLAIIGAIIAIYTMIYFSGVVFIILNNLFSSRSIDIKDNNLKIYGLVTLIAVSFISIVSFLIGTLILSTY
jgi:hypothetical protein